jgi:signal transduction histidine kinase
MRRSRLRMPPLPLRAKVVITLIGGALALLGASTFFSFRYWKSEALVVAEQQALLAGGAVRGSLEAALGSGQPGQARRVLRRFVERGFIEHARVYSAEGYVLVSSNPAEEGTRSRTQWLPQRELVRFEGVARFNAATESVEAFLPLNRPDAVLLEVSFPVGPVRAAMDRGLKLGLALLGISLVGIVVLLLTMLEREVVAPVLRVSGLLDQQRTGGPQRTDEIRGLADSVKRLIEKERAVEALAEQQRIQIAAQAGLAEVGELAAEMAHEFKRPLSSIRTGLQVFDQEYALDPRGEQMMQVIREQLDKLSETMRDLFTIAKPVEFARSAVDLRSVADGALMQLAPHPAMGVVDVERIYEGTPLVHGDAQRLEQVALNLMLNAAEAMPDGGHLRIRVLGEATRAVIEISDTGVGIPPDEVEKVFRPFYSTKPTGTGLGLALAARIIAAHEGAVHVDSEPGRGTTVRVELPVAPADSRNAEGSQWLTHAS